MTDNRIHIPLEDLSDLSAAAQTVVLIEAGLGANYPDAWHGLLGEARARLRQTRTIDGHLPDAELAAALLASLEGLTTTVRAAIERDERRAPTPPPIIELAVPMIDETGELR